MTTIRNINDSYGMPVEFEGATEADAVAAMQAVIRDCGPEFADVIVTREDYEVVPTALDVLREHIEQYGPIRSARVSSAKARGAAANYPYWGAVRYEIRITLAGKIANVALERAGSDRRSVRLADQDCECLCHRENRVRCDRIGTLTEQDAQSVVDQMLQGANA